MSCPFAPPRYRRLQLETLEQRTVLSATSTLDLPEIQVDTTQHDADHILVRFRDGSAPFALAGTRLGQAFDLVPGLYEVELGEGVSTDQALAGYLADPRIDTAERDHRLDVAWVPNDPRFGEQWHLRNTGQGSGVIGADIDGPGAWGVNIGTPRTAVAVMDSGIDYTHPDLYLNTWLNQGEIPASRKANLLDVDRDGLITFWDLNNARNKGPGKITDLNGNGYVDGGDVLAPMIRDASGRDTGLGGWADGVSNEGDRWIDDLVGWNSNANTNNPRDDFGHGTHVAGTIGAVGNNGVGVSGINWRVQLAAVKFFNAQGAGSISQFIEGLEWALAKGIRISNNSWSDSGYTPILYDAVKRAHARGHVFVAAAGNNGRNTDSAPAYPAGFDLDNVVSVASTDRNDRLSGFSNWGVKSVDVAAPGQDILSTGLNKGYNLRSGTSMATPQVTGVIALVWGYRPEWTYRQVIAWVMQTAERVPSVAGKVGSGRLNAALAIRVPARGSLAEKAFLSGISSPTKTSGPTAPGGALRTTNMEAGPIVRPSWYLNQTEVKYERAAQVVAEVETRPLDQVFTDGLSWQEPAGEEGLGGVVRELSRKERGGVQGTWDQEEPFAVN